MTKLNIDNLESFRASSNSDCNNCIKVGMSTCGLAAGAEEIYQTLVEEIKNKNLDILVKKCGCIGLCYAEPVVEVKTGNLPRVFYGKVNKKIALKIVAQHIQEGKYLDDFIYEVDF